MEKKDIYEHLAKIYLDASSNKKKKAKGQKRINAPFSLKIIVVIAAFGLLLPVFYKNRLVSPKTAITSELALVLAPDIVKLNFNFNPAKEEIFSINLNKLDLRRFKTLGFVVRKANFDDKITLKIRFTNALNESSEVYLDDIKSYKWFEHRLAFLDFKKISNWSEMQNLSFIIDEKNTREIKGIVYIDNVRLIR